MTEIIRAIFVAALWWWLLSTLFGWKRPARFFGRIAGVIFGAYLALCVLAPYLGSPNPALVQTPRVLVAVIMLLALAKGYTLYRRGRRIVARATRTQTGRKVRLDLPPPRRTP